MAATPLDHPAAAHNPIDVLEELVDANDWEFDRSSDREMVVEVVGNWGTYRMFFAWQDDVSALYFSCLFGNKVPSAGRIGVTELLRLVNEKLWVGHFDLCSEEHVPIFRHTLLLRGTSGASVELLEDLVDVAMTECERFYPAMQLLLWGGRSPGEAVQAAMMETVGEA